MDIPISAGYRRPDEIRGVFVMVALALAFAATAATCSANDDPTVQPTGSVAASRPPRRPAIQASTIDPSLGFGNIDHLVFVVQENRSFDHYFGTFPGADGIPRNDDGSFDVCVPDPFAGGVCRHARTTTRTCTTPEGRTTPTPR